MKSIINNTWNSVNMGNLERICSHKCLLISLLFELNRTPMVGIDIYTDSVVVADVIKMSKKWNEHC